MTRLTTEAAIAVGLAAAVWAVLVAIELASIYAGVRL